ncbi:NfeD family protein [Roseivirga spongicola]|uniref:NfeD family protein n=1 Tax=Roseivirga spongicola TaxID=333140 RepID=UPI002AC99C58|nr:NfeD family protein [Roseivirga spongicola]WPZ08875.1 NfeD family protein [Roseivirga spongicola]
MGDWISIVLLILIGLVLIYLELLFVPGTTILGLIGLGLCVVGIYLTYDAHGASTGNWVLVGTALVSLIGLVFSFRAKSWNRFSLKTTNQGKFNEGYYSDLTVEMRGLATSDLKPIGKAEFNNKTYEVRSRGEHISSGSSVKIAHVDGNKIIVETTTTN